MVFVPVMGALFAEPRRAAGFAAASAGLIAFVAYQVIVHTLGAYDDNGASWVWRTGGLELWREFAVIFALPISCAGFAAGHLFGGSKK